MTRRVVYAIGWPEAWALPGITLMALERYWPDIWDQLQRRGETCRHVRTFTARDGRRCSDCGALLR